MSPVKGSFSSQGVTTPRLRTTGLEEGMGGLPQSLGSGSSFLTLHGSRFSNIPGLCLVILGTYWFLQEGEKEKG